MIFDHPWLGGLFGDPEIVGLWNAEAQIEHYRAFETALTQALAVSGRVAADQGHAAAEAIGRATIDIDSLAAATVRDGLPIPDFVRQLRAQAVGLEAAIHTGATSQDVLDGALSLTLGQVSRLLIARVQRLDDLLGLLVQQYGANSLMGRTRMQAALPITVADRVATWRQPLVDHMAALKALRPRVERLQLGGPVGTRGAFGADAQSIAAHISDALGLVAGPVWHTDRTPIAEYGDRLSLISGTLGKLGQDIALMAQQGVDDVALEGGGGSSAMPHKSNPILAELLVTLARFNATQLGGLHQALIHEQERSGAAWALEWMILPQMTVTTGRALTAATELCGQIRHLGQA